VLQSATITQHVAGNDPPSSPVEWIKSRSEAVHDLIQKELEDLVKLYKHLHANPELSLQEFQTAARMAKELKRLGFEVTEGVGKTGVVGVLKNGKGPTVLVRTDMDALPVVEQTGLPYASKVRARDACQEQHQLRSEVQQTNAAILQALIRLMHQQNEQIKLYAEQHARLHRRLDQLERLLQPRSTLIPPQGG
jgi:metal-dependent amidase/aminoacylase/carboxypeptidase family protein